MSDSKYLKPTSILIPPELKATLAAEAEAESRSLSAHIVHVLKRHVAAGSARPSAAFQRAVSTSKGKKA